MFYTCRINLFHSKLNIAEIPKSCRLLYVIFHLLISCKNSKNNIWGGGGCQVGLKWEEYENIGHISSVVTNLIWILYVLSKNLGSGKVYPCWYSINFSQFLQKKIWKTYRNRPDNKYDKQGKMWNKQNTILIISPTTSLWE